MRACDFWDAGSESPAESFARDQLCMLVAAWKGRGVARWWRAREAGLSIGRYHRRDSSCDANSPALVRRLSGGRVVPQGPSIACLTIAAPQLAWLDPKAGAVRPEQALNRGLRPLLAALREAGVDAFYPGRDVVTVAGRVLAHAAFTVAHDGTALVQIQVGDRSGFGSLPQLLESFDPAGVAGVSANAFDGATSFLALTGRSLDDAAFQGRLLDALASGLRCDVVPGEPCAGAEVTGADAEAFATFQREPGPLPEGSLSASAVSMLGVVEVAARVEEDCVHGVQVTGDLIAPFAAIDALQEALEGKPAQLRVLRRAVVQAISQPGNFVLGMPQADALDALLARLLPPQ